MGASLSFCKCGGVICIMYARPRSTLFVSGSQSMVWRLKEIAFERCLLAKRKPTLLQPRRKCRSSPTKLHSEDRQSSTHTGWIITTKVRTNPDNLCDVLGKTNIRRLRSYRMIMKIASSPFAWGTRCAASVFSRVVCNDARFISS